MSLFSRRVVVCWKLDAVVLSREFALRGSLTSEESDKVLTLLSQSKREVVRFGAVSGHSTRGVYCIFRDVVNYCGESLFSFPMLFSSSTLLANLPWSCQC